jgi:RNA polymerase sigma factor (sigma-70 family)
VRTDLIRVLHRLSCEGGTLSDGHLLARFVATRDQAAFTALVPRHGRMVLGVCNRVLNNVQDAEDAFQSTFLVLARRAASLVVHESLGPYLYRVAYHTALEASAAAARRRSTERQVKTLPHPVMLPAEPDDWRPLLDLEVNRLPEKYRAAVILCDLEGLTRREAARQLGIREGTLSSRLATAHRMLAKRLARCGLSLSVCAVSAALAEARASGAVPFALVQNAAKAALMAGSTPAVILMMKGAFPMLFSSKWWPVAGAVVVALSLAAVGVGFRSGDTPGAAQAAPPEKPMSELDALKKKVELLTLNLEIVLEKNRSLEAELQTLRGPKGAAGSGSSDATSSVQPGVTPNKSATVPPDHKSGPVTAGQPGNHTPRHNFFDNTSDPNAPAASDELEAALKELRQAKDPETQRRLIEALEKALKKMKDKVGH